MPRAMFCMSIELNDIIIDLHSCFDSHNTLADLDL